jgi:hypothetical protein
MFYILFVLLLLGRNSSYSTSINDTVSNYVVKVLTDKKGKQIFVQNFSGKKVFSKQFFNPSIYYYDLDGDNFDEVIIVDSIPNSSSFNYSLYVYSFEPKFEFCDSLDIGKNQPEFYDLNSDLGYFIKVYDQRFENVFGSALKILPIQFYSLTAKTLLLDNEFSYEEYESELDNLLVLLDEIRRGFDCNNLESKKDIQKILAVIYANLIYMDSHIKIDKFVRQCYSCSDVETFLEVLKDFFK